MEFIRKRIGNTILYNSKKIQKELGVKNLYFKMEGVNPTGKIQDRLAYALVKEAKDLGYSTVTVASLGPLGSSVAYVSSLYEIDCKIFIPENSREKKNKFYKDDHVKVIEYGRTYIDAYEESRKQAEENNWYDANPGYQNHTIASSVYSEIAEEIYNKLGKQPDNIFLFLGDGALLLGLHHGFRTLWFKDKINRIPSIIACCKSEKNAIYKAFVNNQQFVDSAYTDSLRYEKINTKSVRYEVYDTAGVLGCLYDSMGNILCIDNDEIKEAHSELRKLEKIKVYPRGAIAYAAYKKALANDLVEKDNTNVVILEEGQSDLDVRSLSLEDFKDVDRIVKYVMDYLGEYGDPYEDTKEAVELALESGFVLGAFINNKLVGITVICKMSLAKVLPKYHLVYIGSDIKTGSRGIGTRLIKKAVELTEGNMSLHVDFDNKKAMKVYEKMGFKKAYLRMIYEGEE